MENSCDRDFEQFPPSDTRIHVTCDWMLRTTMRTCSRRYSNGPIRDRILIDDLRLKTVVGEDVWHKLKVQPVSLTVSLGTTVALAGATENLAYSLNYGTMTKEITKYVEGNVFKGLYSLANGVASVVLGETCHGRHVSISVEKLSSLLRARSCGIHIRRNLNEAGRDDDDVFISRIHLITIIGVNPWERNEKQEVLVDIIIHGSPLTADDDTRLRALANLVSAYVEESSFQTIEALVTSIARKLCVEEALPGVTVTARKPSALTHADSAGVRITRHRHMYGLQNGQLKRNTACYIGLGSNLGDRFSNICKAIRMMNHQNIKVKKTSSLYESAPMYYNDQPKFLNAVCEVETKKSPRDLLSSLQAIEVALDRVKVIEKGPRSIDLDIILYTDTIINDHDLSIPHIGLLDRPFVLQPLCDIAGDLCHPSTSMTFDSHLKSMHVDELTVQVPQLSNQSATLIMAIYNATPDSFSDGGINRSEAVVDDAKRLINDGASILDIGGQSTRPGALEISEQEELSRVVPVIAKIREAHINILISVDTYRAEVARQAVLAGANIINDVSAGQFDDKMLLTAAELDVPIILMHTRGTPMNMKGKAWYKDVISEVGAELEDRVEAALTAGVKRWNIIVDPGLGFAKTLAHNIAIIKKLGELRQRTKLAGLPWLLGPSRKAFTGTLSGVSEANSRQFGTAGAVAACIAAGAEILRVHDVKEMTQVAKVSDAIWKISDEP